MSESVQKNAFASLLASHQCDSVIVTGASTSGCVRATAVDALQNGYRPVVPREAVGDRNPAAAMPYDASRLYARNVQNLITHLAPEGALVLDFEDEITAGACVTRKETAT